MVGYPYGYPTTVKWESLENVCLVSSSYAGFIGSGALETIGNRVSSVVWLDAFLPANGQRVMDLTTFGKAAQAAADKGEAGFCSQWLRSMQSECANAASGDLGRRVSRQHRSPAVFGVYGPLRRGWSCPALFLLWHDWQ